MSIRILVADDHPLVRDGLRFSIERSDKGLAVIGEASDGLQVLKSAETSPADIYILDITMPHLNGLETARELLKRHPTAKIIILSLHHSADLIREAMETGVRGYLTKETASHNIVEAICEVHAGRSYLSPDIAHLFVSKPNSTRCGKKPVTGLECLTPQERKILQLLAEGHTARKISSDLQRSINTIHAHRKNLMAKLGIHRQADLIRFAVRQGIAKL